MSTLLVVTACSSATSNEAADSSGSVEDYFKGKTITILSSSLPGGGIALGSRALADHLGSHIPGNPRVRVQDMPGASGAVALNHLFSSEVKPDGLTWAAYGARGPIVRQFGGEGGETKIGYDLGKAVPIGSADAVNAAVYMRTDRKQEWQTIEGLRSVAEKPTIGSNTVGSLGPVAGRALEFLLGDSLFKYAPGYGGNADVALGLERGEIDAWGVPFTTLLQNAREDWDAKKFTAIVQSGMPDGSADPRLGDAPTLASLATTDEQKQIVAMIRATDAAGRAFVLPPGVPDNVVQALRTAFVETVSKDEKYRTAAKALGSELIMMSGEDMAKQYQTLFSADDAAIAKFLEIAGPPE